MWFEIKLFGATNPQPTKPKDKDVTDSLKKKIIWCDESALPWPELRSP